MCCKHESKLNANIFTLSLEFAVFTVKSLGVGAVVYDLHWDIDFLLEIYCENEHETVPEKWGTAKKEGILKPDNEIVWGDAAK